MNEEESELKYEDWKDEEAQEVHESLSKYYQLIYSAKTKKYRFFINAPEFLDDCIKNTKELSNFICIGEFETEEEALNLSSSIKHLFSTIVYFEQKTKELKNEKLL
jgi:hypothetical protein